LVLTRCPSYPDVSETEIGNLWGSIHNFERPRAPVSSKQKTWDSPFIEADKATLMASAPDQHHRARLLAVTAAHAGDWLFALPISSCGLRLDDESIRVAVGLRLGVNLREPHQCPCGAQVDCRGTHGLACNLSSGRTARHHYLNDLIWRRLIRAGIPSAKEPSGLSRTGGKRLDGLTLIT